MSWEPKRYCPRCGQMKYALGFVRRFCGDCRAERDEDQKQYLRAWKKTDHGQAIVREHNARYQRDKRAMVLLAAAKTRAKLKGVPFAVSPEERKRLQDVIDAGFCELTGLPFGMCNEARLFTWDSPSLDRVRPALGYVDGNIRVIVYALNAGIGPWGEDIYEMIARSYFDRKWP